MVIYLRGRFVESHFVRHISLWMLMSVAMFNALVLLAPDVLNIIIVDGQMNQMKRGQVSKPTH